MRELRERRGDGSTLFVRGSVSVRKQVVFKRNMEAERVLKENILGDENIRVIAPRKGH